MSNEDPSPEPDEPCGCQDADELMEVPPGRVRAAWMVLRGQAVVPAQIAAEWMDYKIIFNDILTRLGAQLARQAKTEHKRVKKQLELPTPAEVAPPVQGRTRDKSELRRRAAAMRGLGGQSFPVSGGEA